MDVDLRWRFASGGETKTYRKGRMRGKDSAGVYKAEGRHGKRWREVWADEGGERYGSGCAGGRDSQMEVGDGGRETYYDFERRK